MAGRKPKGEIMTQTEMVETGKQKRATSKIYKAESMQITDEAISQTVSKACAELATIALGQKIDLSDIDMVKAVSLQYLKACADAVCFPSMAGLARAMGCDPSTLYRWMKYKHDTETAQWLSVCHGLYSDVLAEASLRNNCNPIVAIFLQKAIYGLRDNITIDVNPPEEGFDEKPADYYKEKYRHLIKGE